MNLLHGGRSNVSFVLGGKINPKIILHFLSFNPIVLYMSEKRMPVCINGKNNKNTYINWLPIDTKKNKTMENPIHS